MQHSLAAEKLGPGGFDSCIREVIEGLSRPEGSGHLTDTKEVLKGILGQGATIATSADVSWVIDTYSPGMLERDRSMLTTALELAGFAGRVVVEKSRSHVSSVELVKGYTFEAAPAWPLVAKLDKPRVLCIDGMIENVSEVHHLLEASGEAKEPMLLFLRGMHDDVKNTLRVNFDRGALVVVPIIVPFDLAGMNMLKDIAVATGCRLVTHLAGDLISSVQYSELSSTDAASVYRNKVVLVNKGNQRSVHAHLKELRTRRSEPGLVDDVGKLLDARIRALSPNHVVIRIPDDKDFVVRSQSIDYALRALKSLVDYGTVIVDGKRQLTSTAAASTVHANKCLNELRSLGCVISP